MIARTCERPGRQIGCRMVAIEPTHTTPRAMIAS